jgi:hypothetical protein
MNHENTWVSVNDKEKMEQLTPGVWVYCRLIDGHRCLSTISPDGNWLKTRSNVTHWMYPEDPTPYEIIDAAMGDTNG